MSAEIAANPLLNAKHEAVLQAFFADPQRIGWRAWHQVYPDCSQRAAETSFSRLLKRAEVAARLKYLDAGVTEKVIESAAVSIEKVVAELVKIGFSNMENYMQPGADGAPRLRFSELTSDQKAALQEVTCEEHIIAGDDDDNEDAKPSVFVRKTKFKLYNKHAALVSLLDHLGGFPAKKLADPDGRALGTGAAEAAKLSDLEVARRIAFTLARGEKAKEKKQ